MVTELLEALGLKPEGDRLVRLGAVGKQVRETQGLGKKLQHKVGSGVKRRVKSQREGKIATDLE